MPDEKPKFNPNKPYKELSVNTDVAEKPSFNPNKPYQEVYGEVGLLNEIEKPKPKFDEIIAGIKTDNDNEKLMLKNLALKVNEGKAKHEDLTEAILTIQGQHSNQGGKKNYYVDNVDGITIPKPLAINERPPKDVTEVFNETSWYQDLGNSILRGSEKLGSALAKTPAFINDLAAIPLNEIANMTAVPLDPTGKLGLEPAFSSKKLAEGFDLPENKIAQYYDEQAKINQENFNQKYDKGITDYVKNGEYSKAFGLLGNSIAESAPTTIGLAVANAGGVGVVQGILGGGAVFGAQKKGELDEQAPNMDEQSKINIAVANGLFEGIFEQFGITKLGGITKDAFLKDGKEAAYKLALDGFKDTYRPVVTKYLGTSAEEALSEAATQFAQNAVDKYSGYKPDMNLSDGVIDAALVGFGAGAGYGLMAGASTETKQKQKIEKANEQSKAIFDIVKQGNDAVVGFKSEIFNGVKNGKLTQAEADNAITKINAFKDYNDMLGSLELNDQNKRELFDLSFQKQSLETEIGGVKDPSKLNPIEQAQYNVKEKFASDLQKQINEIVLKAQINDETVVAKKTVDDVVKLENPPKKEGEKKPKLSPIMQALADKYKKETSKKEIPEDKRSYEDISMTEFNSGKLNARDLHKKTVAYLEKQPNKTMLGNIVEKQFTSPQGKKNKTFGVQLPDGKVMKFSSSMEREEGFRGHMRTEHLVDKDDLVGFPIGLKVEEIPSFEEGKPAKKVIKAFNANTGKFVGYMKETNTGKKVEYNQKQIDYLEDLGTISENPIIPPTEGEVTVTPKTPIKPQPTANKNVQPTKEEYIAQNIEALKNDPDADYNEYLDESGLYTNAFSEKYEKQYGKESTTGTEESESRPDTENRNEGNRTRKGKKGTPKARRKIKDPRYKKALQIEPNTPHELVLQYFIGGGKINSSAIRELYKSAGKEIQARLNYLNKNAPSIEGVAHYIWSNQDVQRWDDTQIKDEVENVVNGYIHPTAMAEALIEAHNEKLNPQEQAMAEVMDEAEKQNLLSETEDVIEEFEKMPDIELTGDDIILRPDIEDVNDVFQEKGEAAGNRADIDKVVNVMQSAMPKVKIVYDEALDASGKWSPKTNTISVNPYYARTDTPIHEAGHILIDAMGGTNNRVIKAAIKQLEGTKLWEETADRYPLSKDYTIDDLGIEVLAEAIGREGAGIFDSKVEESKFKQYLNYIFDWLKRYLGLEKNIAKNLAKQIIAGIGTKKLKGGDGQSLFQKNKQAEIDELNNDLNSIEEQLDLEEDEETITELESIRDAILDKIEALEQEEKDFEKGIKKVKEVADAEDLTGFTLDELIEAYHDARNYDGFADKEMLNKVRQKIAIDLNNKRIKELNNKFGEEITEYANSKDLRWRDVWQRTLGHITEDFPALQELNNVFDLAFMDMQIERSNKKSKFEKLGKAVIEEYNKKMGVAKSALSLVTSNSAKYFDFIEENGKLRTNVSGLTNAQKEFLSTYKELLKERNKLSGKDVNDNEIEIIKTDKGFRENYQDNGFLEAMSSYMGGGGDISSEIDYINPKTNKKERVLVGQAQKAIIDYYKDDKLKYPIALAKLLSVSYKAKKAGEKGAYSDYKGKLTSKFDQPQQLIDRLKLEIEKLEENPTLNAKKIANKKQQIKDIKNRQYSKDFYSAGMSLIDDITHVKHMAKFVPLTDSIEQFYEGLKLGKGKDSKNTKEFIQNWRDLFVYQRRKETDPIVDYSLKMLRSLTSKRVMAFNLLANISNVVIGNLNNLRAESAESIAKGNKRLFASDGKLSKKGLAILDEYNIIQLDFDSNPKLYAGKLLDFLAYGLQRWGEKQIQGSMFLGQLSDKEWSNFEYKDDKLSYKGDESELKKQLIQYQKRVTDIQGKYGEKERRAYMMYEHGKVLGQFKTFIPDWWKMRFGERYIDSYGVEHAGTWRTFNEQAWADVKNDLRKLKVSDASIKVWNGDDFKNFRSNVKGLMIIAALFAWKYSDDDDDEKRKKAGMIENTLGQMLFIFDPHQLKYTVTSPPAAIGTLGKMIDITEDLVTKHDGDKAWKDFQDVLPYNRIRKVPNDVEKLIGNDKK